MRHNSAESREIDLMMRQWKPAKQTPARSSGWVRGKLSKAAAAMRGRFGLVAASAVLMAAVAGFASSADAQAAVAPQSTATALTQPTETRTALTVTTRPAGTQSGAHAETVFTAHVTDAAGAVLGQEQGAGSVSFEVGPVSSSPGAVSLQGSSLGSSAVDENGNATLAVTSLPVAANGSATAVHAVYHPAAESAARTAGSVSTAAMVQADASGVPDFVLTLNPSTLTVTQGQSGTTAVTITPLNGFSEQVTLSCSALPAQVTCIFSPVIESTANGAFTSTLEIQTQAASGALVTPPGFGAEGRGHIALAWVAPGMLALVGFAALRRRALGGWLGSTGLVLLIAIGMGGLGGCSTRYGYIHHPPSVATGTLVGTYTLSIDASGNDGSAVTEHDMSLVLQVK